VTPPGWSASTYLANAGKGVLDAGILSPVENAINAHVIMANVVLKPTGVHIPRVSFTLGADPGYTEAYIGGSIVAVVAEFLIAEAVAARIAAAAAEGAIAAEETAIATNATAGSIRGVNPTGSGTNCVNCVVATDATLSGYPASALPSGARPISVLEDVFGGTFKPVTGRAEIEALLTDAGAGARGVVFGSRGSEVGHVFNAVNQGGTVRFLDGQIGGAASFDGFDGFLFMLVPGS